MRNLNQIGLLTGIALAVGMIGVNIADGTFTVSCGDPDSRDRGT